MYCWRVCMQVFLFLLIVFWAGFCAKLSMDTLAKREKELRDANDNDNAGLDDPELNDANSTRMMRFIHRSVVKAHKEHKRHLDLFERLEIARELVHVVAQASEAERNGELNKMVDSGNAMDMGSQQCLDARELLAADLYNLEHHIKK